MLVNEMRRCRFFSSRARAFRKDGGHDWTGLKPQPFGTSAYGGKGSGRVTSPRSRGTRGCCAAAPPDDRLPLGLALRRAIGMATNLVWPGLVPDGILTKALRVDARSWMGALQPASDG